LRVFGKEESIFFDSRNIGTPAKRGNHPSQVEGKRELKEAKREGRAGGGQREC